MGWMREGRWEGGGGGVESCLRRSIDDLTVVCGSATGRSH